ncbi:unnamed protein product [Rotaria sordida]|uniref:Uncharacterized protein n=1 Tax=Rotaria sordida TaxID=392033 RepID=A0A815Q6T1_9BILA|nr:unnamed protein product [Rotaria sordida]CAF3858151.1 unnamed protein product [Rotaria sordida]
MALPPVNIHDVAMQNDAYSLTGELGTTGLSPCVAVIILFSDRTIMMEHRSDIELYKYGYKTQVLNLLENIAKNIISMKRIHLNIRYAFIIGGCVGKRRKRFQRSLMSIYEECRKEEQDPSDLLYLRLMYDICESLKIINVSWSIERKQVHDRNDPFIDVLVARRQQDNNYHLFIRQAVQQGNLSLAGAQFYMNNDLAEPYRPGQA